MEKTESERLRELLVMQLGSQILQLCEVTAKLQAAEAQLAKLNESRLG